MVKIRWENVVFDTLGWIWGIRQHIEQLRQLLPDAERRERDVLNQVAKEFEWDYESYSEKNSEIESKFSYWLPRVAAYSIITMLHALVETQMRTLADRLRYLRGETLKPNEISGDAIERSKIYLVKVMKLPVADAPEWQTLRELADIRHIIVHKQGAVGSDEKRRKRVEDLKRRYPNELSERIGELDISLLLCEQFLDTVEDFFRQVFVQAGLPQKAVVESDEGKKWSNQEDGVDNLDFFTSLNSRQKKTVRINTNLFFYNQVATHPQR